MSDIETKIQHDIEVIIIRARTGEELFFTDEKGATTKIIEYLRKQGLFIEPIEVELLQVA